MEEFCRKYGATEPAEIHLSLNNLDKISAIIYQQRLLAYPAGQAYNGFLFEYGNRADIKVSRKR
jgi:hypothetical protein